MKKYSFFSTLQGWLRLGGRGTLRLAMTAAFLFGGPALAATVRISVDSGGLKRSAVLVEQGRLKRIPRTIVIALHGQSGNGLRARHNLGLDNIVKLPSVVTVYPDALDGHWDVNSPNNTRDVQFIQDLIQKLVSDGVADRRRIFVMGVSTGGVLAIQVACREAGNLAGVSALLALMPAADFPVCAPARAVPFFLLAGTSDPLVPYAGGQANLIGFKADMASADATLAPFLKANGCRDKKTTIDVPDIDVKDHSVVRIDRFEGCAAPVERVRVEGGGHTLPGRIRGPDSAIAASLVGQHNNDVDASKLVWDFFQRVRAR